VSNQLTITQKAGSFVRAILNASNGALENVLPAHIKPERFRRNLSTAIIQHPKLLNCDPVAVLNEVAKAAALGLLLDPQLGEAYLITGWSKDGDVPQLRIGYRGLIKLARQSGDISSIYAHEICDLDRFHVSLGTDKKIVHEPNYLADRGSPFAYYAVVHFKDGTSDFEIMTLREVHTIRERSDGYKAFKAGRIKSTPWDSDEGEMSKKTVLRRLSKRVPQSPELADALAIEDADFEDVEVVASDPARIRPEIKRAAELKSPEAVDPETADDLDPRGDMEDDAPKYSGELQDFADARDDQIDTATNAQALQDAFGEMIDGEGEYGDQWKALKIADQGRASQLAEKAKAKIRTLRKG
jgi:phage RecT family recombinase